MLEASPHRVPHIWRQASIDVAPELRPGGADFGHIALAHQRELKVRVLTEAFDKFAGGSAAIWLCWLRSDYVLLSSSVFSREPRYDPSKYFEKCISSSVFTKDASSLSAAPPPVMSSR